MPFKVKFTTVFDKLFKAYCSRKSLDVNSVVFMTSGGDRIIGSQTPADVRQVPLCLACISLHKSSLSSAACMPIQPHEVGTPHDSLIAVRSLTWRTAMSWRCRHIKWAGKKYAAAALQRKSIDAHSHVHACHAANLTAAAAGPGSAWRPDNSVSPGKLQVQHCTGRPRMHLRPRCWSYGLSSDVCEEQCRAVSPQPKLAGIVSIRLHFWVQNKDGMVGWYAVIL